MTMKKYCFWSSVIMLIFLVSCSGKYDNAIKDYIGSTEIAKDIKIQEVKELKKVTVGDSINYINLKAEQALRAQIDVTEKQMATFQQDLVKLGTSSKVVTDAYAIQLAKTQREIDSLKAIKPEPTKLYENKKTDEVIAVVVECKYTTDGGEQIKNLVLSPDGKKCYGYTDNPEMSPEK